MVFLWYLVVLISACCSPVGGVLQTPDWIPESDVYIPGDINIGVSAGSSYSHCKYKSKSRTQARTGLKYWVHEINKNDTLLPNITLGLVWLDNCWETDVALMRSLKMLPLGPCFNECCSKPVPGSLHPNEKGCYDVAGFIAPWRNSQVGPLSRLASMYHIPHISIGSSSDDYSDRTEFPYLMRLNPPDSLQIRVIVDTIVHFNWTYLSVVGDYTGMSRNLVSRFKRAMKQVGTCIAFFDEIGSDFVVEDYEQFVRRMAVHEKAKVVVILAETVETGYFLDAVHKLELNRKFLLVTTIAFVLSNEGDRFLNSMSVGFSFSDGLKTTTYDFTPVYETLSPWAYLTDPLAEKPDDPEELGCSLEYPEGHNESCFTKYKTWADIPGHRVYGHHNTFADVFDVFVIGLHRLISRDCPEAFNDKSLLKTCINGTEFLKVLYNVTFYGASGLVKFDPNGDGIIDYTMGQVQFTADNDTKTKMQEIALWTYDKQEIEVYADKVKWQTYDENMMPVDIEQPESVCAKACSPGEFYIQGELKCCWDCRRCRDNEIVRNDSLGCEICPILTWPDQDNFTQCEPIPPTYMLWNDPIALAIEVISAIGLVSCFLMTFLMIKFRSHKVIKGSSVEQMSMILMAIYLCYVTTILLIVRPGFYLCYVEYCTYHLSCSFIFVPLFLKTSRLYRIFRAAERCQQEVSFVSAQALMIFSLLLIAGQIIALCVSMVLFPIGDTLQMPIVTERFVELVCINQIENLLIPLSYNLFVLFMCLLFGFLTRKLPDNFNESWYIFLSVATTLFIWIAFLPTYFMAFYAYHKGALLALALILNALVTSVCLFVPKIYALYFIPEGEIKTSNFDASSRSTGVTKTSSQKN